MFSELGKFIAYNSCLIYYILIDYSTNFFKDKQCDKQILSKVVKNYNIVISICSWIIFFVTLYENRNLLNTSALVCSNHTNSMISFFYYLKYIEWTDTLFLVIKKKNISFLHYFHHMIVPLFVYANYAFINTAGQSYVMLSNSLAHGLMYMYYAYPKDLKKYSKIVTSVQTIQHFGALIILLIQIFNYFNEECKYNKDFVIISLINYIIFFYEFFKILIK
tara:strand:+ start:488 stop:1147 length:660 start_codon:yes stop_codon:yes gene_type:complete